MTAQANASNLIADYGHVKAEKIATEKYASFKKSKVRDLEKYWLDVLECIKAHQLAS